MYIENGRTKYEDILNGTERGLLIIDVQGLHSGLNTISGDFSLSAYGHLIENGKIALEGKKEDVLSDKHVKEAYIGIV